MTGTARRAATGSLNITLCKKNMSLGQQGFILGQTSATPPQTGCRWVSICPLAHIVLAIFASRHSLEINLFNFTKKQGLLALAAAGFALAAALPAHAGKTLDAVKARGQVVCGVNTGLAGFAAADSSGNWSGLDVDMCKAVAAAVLSDASKVKYVPLNAQQRFTALQSGEIDMLSRNTTFTLTRDASLGLHQTVVTYYDGQGFMVPVKSKIKSAKQLKGQTVCVQSGTTTRKT